MGQFWDHFASFWDPQNGPSLGGARAGAQGRARRPKIAPNRSDYFDTFWLWAVDVAALRARLRAACGGAAREAALRGAGAAGCAWGAARGGLRMGPCARGACAGGGARPKICYICYFGIFGHFRSFCTFSNFRHFGNFCNFDAEKPKHFHAFFSHPIFFQCFGPGPRPTKVSIKAPKKNWWLGNG